MEYWNKEWIKFLLINFTTSNHAINAQMCTVSRPCYLLTNKSTELENKPSIAWQAVSLMAPEVQWEKHPDPVCPVDKQQENKMVKNT